MRLLLDTHVLLWWLGRFPRLGAKAQAAIGNPASEALVSSLSAAEIEIKRARGKIDAPDDLAEQLVRHGFTELAFTIAHALALRELPMHHRDPFDRMLIAQARREGLTVVTANRAIGDYDVPILSATD